MAWGSAKRRISGKIASGAFQKPDNTLQKGIMAAGDIAVSKIMKAEEEERLEKRRQKAAAAAEAKRLAAEQRKKEEEAQKLARQAKAIATRYGAQGNTEFINYATEQLYTFGDSAAALIESDYKSGRLAIGEKETGPMQGPLLQPMTDDELRIAENTTLDAYRAAEGDADPNTPDAKTNIVTSFKADGGIDAQMNSILDRTGALSDEQIASQTYEGITIDPDAVETTPIDWMDIGTDPDKVATLRRMVDAGERTLSEKDAKILASTEKKIKEDAETAAAKDESETGQKLSTMEVKDLQGVVLNESYSQTLRDRAQAILDGKLATQDLEKAREIKLDYLGAGSIADALGKIKQVSKDTRLTDEDRASVIMNLRSYIAELEQNATAARNATKNANKTQEVIALEALQNQPAYQNLTPEAQASININFASIFKPKYDSIDEAVAAYNTADQIGYEDQKTRIENLINGTLGSSTTKVFGVDEEGFGRIYFVSRQFDPATSSVVTSTNSGAELPDVQISMDDYEAKDIMAERRSLESGLKDYNKQVAAFFTLGATMQDIVDIAKEDERVLTRVSGLMKTVASFVGEADTFVSILNDMPLDENGNVSREAYEQALREKGVLAEGETLENVASNQTFTDAIFSDDKQSLIQARRSLEAKLALAPFKLGAAEGTTGTAMSNQDRDLFMKFFTSFRKSGELEKNFAEYLAVSKDELGTLVQRYLPGSAELETFKNANGYYPTTGFAKTLEEYAQDHPNSQRYTQLLQNISQGTISSSDTQTAEPEQTTAMVTEAMAAKLPSLKPYVGQNLTFTKQDDGQFYPVIPNSGGN